MLVFSCFSISMRTCVRNWRNVSVVALNVSAPSILMEQAKSTPVMRWRGRAGLLDVHGAHYWRKPTLVFNVLLVMLFFLTGFDHMSPSSVGTNLGGSVYALAVHPLTACTQLCTAGARGLACCTLCVKKVELEWRWVQHSVYLDRLGLEYYG